MRHRAADEFSRFAVEAAFWAAIFASTRWQLTNGFRERYRIANAAFLQMNLFRPPFRDDSIDIVICNGVLHHTGEPRKGFEALLRKVKPGGYILIELYNRYGRLPTLWPWSLRTVWSVTVFP
jgi:SAM-dependent methyltransferase